jgi:hypothetical protein
MTPRIDLPTWAQSAICRELLAAIIADQPEPRTSKAVPSIFGGGREPCAPWYPGKPAARLRRIYSEWLDRKLTEHSAYGEWDNLVAREILRTESADQLIDRALIEAKKRIAANREQRRVA